MVTSYDKVLRDSLIPQGAGAAVHSTWLQREDTGLYTHVEARLSRIMACPTDVLHEMILQGKNLSKYLDFKQPASKAKFMLTRFALRDAETLIRSERRHLSHQRFLSHVIPEDVVVDVLHTDHTAKAIRSLLDYWQSPQSLDPEDFESSELSAKIKYLAYFLTHFLVRGVVLDKEDIAQQFGVTQVSVHNGMRRGIEILKQSAKAGRLPQNILDALEIACDKAALGLSQIPEATGSLFELEVISRGKVA